MRKLAKPPEVRYVTESPEILIAMGQIGAVVSITDEMIEDIKKVHRKTLQAHQITRAVFTLDAYPNVLFKECLFVSLDGAAFTHRDERFFNMVVAKDLCLKHNWTHLIIPSAKQVTVDDKLYIVAERLDIIVNDARQEFFLVNNEKRAEKSVDELRELIFCIGLSGVDLRNISVLGDPTTSEGDLCLTLHDLEVVDVNAPEKGLFGFRTQIGLMGLLGHELSKKLLAHFQENVPAYAKQAEEAYRLRKHELDIKFFYQKKNITAPETLLSGKVGVPPQLCQNSTVSDQIASEGTTSSEMPYCQQCVYALARRFFNCCNEHYKKNIRNPPTDLRAAREIIFKPAISVSGTICPHCPTLPTVDVQSTGEMV